MLSRRAFIAASLLVAAPPKLLGKAMIATKAMTATIAMTFDTDITTYTNALWDMAAKGIPGTFFADADRIGGAEQPSRDNLVLMAMNQWEIGARVYGTINGAEANMVSVLTNNRDIALDRLKTQRDMMYALGFDTKSIAASQRAWSPHLRGLAAGLFENVRVADVTAWGSYPVRDRLYVREGGTASWSSADTGASLSAQLDAVISCGGFWVPVIHKVNDPASADPNYTVSFNEFKVFTAYLQSKIAAGLIRATTFSDAMVQP